MCACVCVYVYVYVSTLYKCSPHTRRRTDGDSEPVKNRCPRVLILARPLCQKPSIVLFFPPLTSSPKTEPFVCHWKTTGGLTDPVPLGSPCPRRSSQVSVSFSVSRTHVCSSSSSSSFFGHPLQQSNPRRLTSSDLFSPLLVICFSVFCRLCKRAFHSSKALPIAQRPWPSTPSTPSRS